MIGGIRPRAEKFRAARSMCSRLSVSRFTRMIKSGVGKEVKTLTTRCTQTGSGHTTEIDATRPGHTQKVCR
ncbi:hypothetical protein WN55_00091 [Dufourea novaeangliae]|uniref:Uncharacterized protein n=1 Tax=Dufourea novaeangliae TaxID=178035 RepID=A0A154NWF1_DUFNO|nr:hypothetical protein WN55_00091 [Dufourea novaeangliae]